MELADPGLLVRINLASGAWSNAAFGLDRAVGGFTAPFTMAVSDASESAILPAECDPANRIALIDLAYGPASRAWWSRS